MNTLEVTVQDPPAIRPHDLIYNALGQGTSRITLQIPVEKAWAHFGNISEIQEFVARAASRYKKQGTVQEFQDFIEVVLA